MKQYEHEKNKLTLSVKKSPMIARFFLFFLSGVFLIMPMVWIITAFLTNQTWHFGSFLGLILFLLAGVYSLRMALWNAYGKETFCFNHQEIQYEACYKWFKDGKEMVKFTNPTFSIKPIDYIDDRKGLLVISENDNNIQSVVKMPINQIEEIILLIKGNISKRN